MLRIGRVSKTFHWRALGGAAIGLAMGLALGLQPNSGAAQSLVEGLRLFEIGDFEGALREWRPLAERGDPDALFNIGQLYRMGRGVPADLSTAESYYRRAADAGHITATANLATILYFNGGSPARRIEAIRLWRRAAAAGDGRSQYMMAVLHHNGEEVDRDPVQAYAWILLALEDGVEDAVQAEAIMRTRLDDNGVQQARVLSRGLLAAAPEPPAAAEPTSPVAPPEMMASSGEPKPVAETPTVTEPAAQPATSSPPENATAATTGAPEAARNDTTPRLDGYRSLDGRWRVQLGSFREAGNARVLKAGVEEAMGARLGGLWWDLPIRDMGPDKGEFYRLLLGPMRDRAGATVICDELKARGYDCFVVAP